jgi:hypothetical protein
VAAAVAQGSGLAVGIEKKNDVLAQQREGPGPPLQIGQRHDGMPELAENGLLRDEHESDSFGCVRTNVKEQFPASGAEAERFYSACSLCNLRACRLGMRPA